MKNLLKDKAKLFKPYLTQWNVILALAAVVGCTTPAQALQFNFTYEEGTSLQQMLGFETAGKIWSSYLRDDATINIHVGITDQLPTNVLGGALPAWQANQNYGQFRDKLYADRTSGDDYTAYDSLNSSYYSTYLESSTWSHQNIALTNANAKALGIIPGQDNALDGVIMLNDLSNYSFDWGYDYQRNNSPDNNSIDLLSVALHEIGHILGFASGVDSTETNDANADVMTNYERVMHTTSLDMFRYSNRSNNNGLIDLGYGYDTYFSIDGGNNALAYFSTGDDTNLGFGGDGYQASHWKKQSNSLGILDPDLALGEIANISDLDLRAFDVIGYDRQWGVNLNFASLEEAAKNDLAQDIADEFGWGQGNSSLIDSYINGGYNYTAGSWLTQDQNQAIETMLVDSELYEWGWGRTSGSRNRFWQENDSLWSEFFWQEIPDFETQTKSTTVPEPTSNFGILCLGLFGLSSWLKGSKKK